MQSGWQRSRAMTLRAMSLPQTAGALCFPSGLLLVLGDSPPPPTYACFVLTDAHYERFYGHCLTTYSPLSADLEVELSSRHRAAAGGGADDDGVAEAAPAESARVTTIGALSEATVFAPQCLCLISRSHFPAAFKAALLALDKLARDSAAAPLGVAVETTLMHLVDNLPRPVPGGPTVRFLLHPDLPALHLACGSPEELPSLDYSFAVLANQLAPRDLIKVVLALALELQVVVVSADPEHRFAACELLLSLLHPLQWVQVYVPTLPDGPWLDLLRAPFPILVGLAPHQLEALPRPLPHRMVVVMLDSGKVTGPGEATPRLPQREAAPLLKELSAATAAFRAPPPFELPDWVPSWLPLPDQFPRKEAGQFPRKEAGQLPRKSEAGHGGGPPGDFNGAGEQGGRDSVVIPVPLVSRLESDQGQGNGEEEGRKDGGAAGRGESDLGERAPTEHAAAEARVRNAFLRFFVSLLRDLHRAVASVPVADGPGGMDAELAAQEEAREAFLAAQPQEASALMTELVGTQMFRQLAWPEVDAGSSAAERPLGSRPFELALHRFLREQVETTGARSSAAPSAELRTASVAVHEVPLPQPATPPDPDGYRYPQGFPTDLRAAQLRPLPLPMPLFEGELPPPLHSTRQMRADWTAALAELERRAKQKQVGQEVGVSIGTGAVIGGVVAATALGCSVQ